MSLCRWQHCNIHPSYITIDLTLSYIGHKVNIVIHTTESKKQSFAGVFNCIFSNLLFVSLQSYSVGGLGDEDFNIPPITPPTLPDHMLPSHLPHDSPSGPYHPLDPPSRTAPHHPYQLQGMDLPGMPGSQNGGAMLNQDGGTCGPMTSTLSVVSRHKFLLVSYFNMTFSLFNDFTRPCTPTHVLKSISSYAPEELPILRSFVLIHCI